MLTTGFIYISLCMVQLKDGKCYINFVQIGEKGYELGNDNFLGRLRSNLSFNKIRKIIWDFTKDI